MGHELRPTKLSSNCGGPNSKSSAHSEAILHRLLSIIYKFNDNNVNWLEKVSTLHNLMIDVYAAETFVVRNPKNI